MHAHLFFDGLSQHLLIVLLTTLSKERIFKYRGGAKNPTGDSLEKPDDIIKEFSKMQKM